MECARSTRVFAEQIMPHWVPVEMSKLHLSILDLLDDMTQSKVAVMGPRGAGKTSLLDVVYAGKEICFEQTKFIVPISNSYEVASMQTDNLRRELATNKAIHTLFGKMTAVGNEGMREMYGKRAWVAKMQRRTDSGEVYYHKCLVMPRGEGQQIRGLLFDGQRPHRLLIDDLSDRRTIHNEEVREKRFQWFYSDVLHCVNQLYDDGHRFFYIDTLKHADDLLPRLMKDEDDWAALTLPICDQQYQTKFPDIFPQWYIDKLVADARRTGTLTQLAMEMMCIPVNPESQGFKEEQFIPYDELEAMLNHHPYVKNVVIVDPNKGGDTSEAAIVVVGIDIVTNTIYVRDVWAEKCMPDRLYDTAVEMAMKYNAEVLGVEVTGLKAHISQPMQNALAAAGIGRRCKFVELHARKGEGEFSGRGGGKKARILSMQPYYARGAVRHNKAKTGKLELQLLNHEGGGMVDCADALGYTPQIMEQGKLYFWKDSYAQMAQQYGLDKGFEAVYAQLAVDEYAEDPEFKTLDEQSRSVLDSGLEFEDNLDKFIDHYGGDIG